MPARCRCQMSMPAVSSTPTFIARKTRSIGRAPDLQDWPARLSGIARPACQTIPSQGLDRRPVLTKEYPRFINVGRPHPDAASLPSAIVRHLEMKRIGNRLGIFAVQPVVVPHWCPPPSCVELARFRVYNLVTSVARSRHSTLGISAILRLRSGRCVKRVLGLMDIPRVNRHVSKVPTLDVAWEDFAFFAPSNASSNNRRHVTLKFDASSKSFLRYAPEFLFVGRATTT
jgi:hypothetical protein